MMLGYVLNRILHTLYPVLVFGFVVLIWSSSNLAEVVALTPPPVYDGFNFFWNPSRSLSNSCEQKRASKIPIKEVCSSIPSDTSFGPFTTPKAPLKKQIKQTQQFIFKEEI